MATVIDRMHALGLYGPHEPPQDARERPRRCQGCGCTDDNACWDDAEGRACSWVDAFDLLEHGIGGDMCSVCFRNVAGVEGVHAD